MAGSIDECNVDDALARQSSDQTSLFDYGSDDDEYFVGIVNSANTELQGAVDKNDDRLAPDDFLFRRWLNRRDELRESGSRPKVAHNDAFKDVNYRSRFLDQIDDDVIDEYVERIQDGENIVLVCYCDTGRRCHRRIVKELIHTRMCDDE